MFQIVKESHPKFCFLSRNNLRSLMLLDIKVNLTDLHRRDEMILFSVFGGLFFTNDFATSTKRKTAH